jgi:hypothetical protein
MVDSPYNFPANSKKAEAAAGVPAEPERPALKKVISGNAKIVKPPLGKRIASAFSGDDMHSVANYVVMDVALPALKALLSDVVSQGVDRALFGTGANRGGYRSPVLSNKQAGSTGYSVISTAKATSTPPPTSEKEAPKWNEIVLADRPSAEAVLAQMIETLQSYGMVTVNDLLDLVGITGSFTDLRWGWVDLGGATIRPARGGGYQLVLDNPVDLKK